MQVTHILRKKIYLPNLHNSLPELPNRFRTSKNEFPVLENLYGAIVKNFNIFEKFSISGPLRVTCTKFYNTEGRTSNKLE